MNIAEKIKKIEGLTAEQVLKKVAKKINKKIYYSHRKIKVRMRPITLSDTYFTDFRTDLNFIFDIRKKEQYKTEIKRLSSADEIITAGDKICNHIFNLLGSGDRYLGETLPWNEDFKTGFKWKDEFYKDIKIVDLSNNADVKIPWELSRFQHIFSLGKAYWLTDEERYALEFNNQVMDWIEKNPIEMTVNWTCTMDVAIRAVNLICGYFFFEKSSSIDKKFWTNFNKLIYLHGRFIYKNLENEGKYNGNHYLSDLAGLIWIGMYFGNFSVENLKSLNIPSQWLKFGISEFENEIEKQMNDDGTNYEASTSYHRLVTEIYLFTTILCNKNNIYLSEQYMDKLQKMCEFIMDITKPNGLSPFIGDEDDGRFIILSDYSSWNRKDFRNVLAIAGEYFDRDDFRVIGRKHKEDALWLMNSFKNVSDEAILKSTAYKDGGYYLLRNDRIYCLIRCGELSCRGEGGHSHNDQLSFEINADGEDFIIDPGTYVYTADYRMRNLYRSTKMHNTLYIEGYEQNDFNNHDLFYMKEQTFSRCKEFCGNMFLGEHYGYKSKCGVVHERKFSLQGNELLIEDRLIGQKIDNKVYVNFMLNKDIDIEEKNNCIVLTKNGKKIFIEFSNSYLVQDSNISDAYGRKCNTKKITINAVDMEIKLKIKLANLRGE